VPDVPDKPYLTGRHERPRFGGAFLFHKYVHNTGIITGMDFDTYDTMPVEQLADIREYGLERLQRVTEALKNRVRSDYADGVSVKRLARLANVSRATISSWVKS